MTTPREIENKKLQDAMSNACRDKAVAELRLQAAFLTYSAIHLSAIMDQEAEQKTRAQIHAIIDVILDADSLKYHCFNRLQQAAG